MAEGGTWAVPRSGLIFMRKENMLTLINRMPHHPDMQITEKQLHKQQQAEYEQIKEEFNKVGVIVRDET
jgi:hypothetical protein